MKSSTNSARSLGGEWSPVDRERSLRHFRVVEAGSDDFFQHTPAWDQLGRIFELLVFQDAEDFGDRRADHLSGGLRGLVG